MIQILKIARDILEYIILLKIIFFIYNKAAFIVNVLHICYNICCSYAGMS